MSMLDSSQDKDKADESRGNVVVVGAGLVGAMTGILLGRSNYNVKIFELRKGVS